MPSPDSATSPPGPIVERPKLPGDYGMPTTPEGLLDWAPIEARLEGSRVYWIATAGRDGQPHVRPVDGLFVDGVLYVGGSPETRWMRDLAANPRVSVHLDDASDVVILEGEAAPLLDATPELARRLARASNEKYPEYGMTEESYSTPGPVAVRFRRAFAWREFPRDLTRFRFDAG